jgi:hypothetical protein
VNRHGCVLWIDGARVAAATTVVQSCSSTRASWGRRPPYAGRERLPAYPIDVPRCTSGGLW